MSFLTAFLGIGVWAVFAAWLIYRTEKFKDEAYADLEREERLSADWWAEQDKDEEWTKKCQ